MGFVSEIVVLGSGSWGTALSCLFALSDASVLLWGRSNDEIGAIQKDRENRKFLPGVKLPENVRVSGELPARADLWVIAVPSAAFREVCERIPNEPCGVLIATKGLEEGTSRRMSEVLEHVRPNAEYAVLSGPNLAIEVARGVPTASVAASPNAHLASQIQMMLTGRSFRVYTSRDVVGVELGGALKNVFAIGAGISDGLGFGDNTKGAFLARSLREMSILGCAMGAERTTFLGLSGVGDLFATAASRLSRNYRLGRYLAEGKPLAGALESVGQVAEGVPTCIAASHLADSVNVPIPLMSSILKVLKGEATPLSALAALMERPAGSEFESAT